MYGNHMFYTVEFVSPKAQEKIIKNDETSKNKSKNRSRRRDEQMKNNLQQIVKKRRSILINKNQKMYTLKKVDINLKKERWECGGGGEGRCKSCPVVSRKYPGSIPDPPRHHPMRGQIKALLAIYN